MQQRLPIVLSVTALLVALLGWTGIAESTIDRLITGKDIKNSSIGSIDIKNGAVTGRDVKNGSLTGADIRNGTLRALDFRPGELVVGAPGPQGPKGDAGEFPDTLPSKMTIRGAYGVSGTASAGETLRAFGSFLFRVPPDTIDHFIEKGAARPPECPGTAASPEAQPGHLCVYEHVRQGTPSIVIDDPGGNGVETGFILQTTVAAGGTFQSRGTWAVTAP